MRVWEKSAEAVVAKKAWKQAGAKGRRTKRQTVETTPGTASSIPKQANVATAATIRTGDPKELVDSSLITGTRNASPTWAKEE